MYRFVPDSRRVINFATVSLSQNVINYCSRLLIVRHDNFGGVIKSILCVFLVAGEFISAVGEERYTETKYAHEK